MFRIFRRKRKFSLTFAISGYSSTMFTCELNGLSSSSQFHIGYEVEIYGKVNRDIIMKTIRDYANKCTNEEEKKVLKYLIENAVLIAWNIIG